MPSAATWSAAFHRQAESDWKVFLLLQPISDVPPCHALHYLQMATEKLAKAWRLLQPGVAVNQIMMHHVGLPAFINAYLLSPSMRVEFTGRSAQLRSIRYDCRRIAEAIERLAPAVDRERTPSNVEYLWAVEDACVVPVDHPFPELARLEAPAGHRFLLLVQRAFREYPGRP